MWLIVKNNNKFDLDKQVLYIFANFQLQKIQIGDIIKLGSMLLYVKETNIVSRKKKINSKIKLVEKI